MKALIQVVKSAKVTVDGNLESSIDSGLLVFLGIEEGDTSSESEQLANKLLEVRIIPDQDGKMNLSVQDSEGEIMVISQFTLCGELNSGRRPSFSRAKNFDEARKLYQHFLVTLENMHENSVQSGKFGEYMEVGLTNDGPVTLMVEC